MALMASKMSLMRTKGDKVGDISGGIYGDIRGNETKMVKDIVRDTFFLGMKSSPAVSVYNLR
jgi:hypothetical protein